MGGYSPEYVRRQARERLGAAADVWLTTPNPLLEDGIAPEGLLQSDCIGCIGDVLNLLDDLPEASGGN